MWLAQRVEPSRRHRDGRLVDRERSRPRERYEDIVDAICAWHDEARAGKVFGMPCVKRSGKVVFGFSRTGMVFKLTDPDVHRRALALPGAHLFDPSGRGEAFRQWVVVPAGAGRRMGGARLRGARPGSRGAAGGARVRNAEPQGEAEALPLRHRLQQGESPWSPVRTEGSQLQDPREARQQHRQGGA